MGAFFLFKKNDDVDLGAVEQVFRKKGFTSPFFRKKIRDWTIWLYKKQLIETPNYIEDHKSCSLYVTGTVVYKKLGYSDSLKQLLIDFKNNSIDRDSLFGSFCLLFCNGQTLSFLTDSLNVHHIFTDKNLTRISTSFLALLVSHTKKLKINKLAFFEKLSTGYIISPDTLVEGIQQIDENIKVKISNESSELIWMEGWKGLGPGFSFHSNGFEDSLEKQVIALETYFHQVDGINNEYNGELGLSAGFDSRLLLASASSTLSSSLKLHTHNTIGVHEVERVAAEEIARIKGLQIRIVDTSHIEAQSPGRVSKILLEGLYFFDARCSYDMGAYSETYTAGYKKQVLGENRLSFNGLGGEIFRNHWLTFRKRFNTFEWMKARLYYYYAEEALNDPRLFQKVHSHMMSKLVDRLQTDISQTMSFFEMRRYYSEVRMPDCDGVNHNAQNQIGFYLTPFIEPMVIREALNATPYIGPDGNYQARLVTQIDPVLASVRSSYGFPFDRIPVPYLIQSAVKGYIPNRFTNMGRRYFKRRGRGQHLLESYSRLKKRCDYLSSIERAFSDFFPKYNWEIAMCDNLQKPTAVFLASFLHEFSDRLYCES